MKYQVKNSIACATALMLMAGNTYAQGAPDLFWRKSL